MKSFEKEYARAVDRKGQQAAHTLDEYDAAAGMARLARAALEGGE